MIDRIVDAFWRFRYRLAMRRSIKSYRERCERNGWFVAVIVAASITQPSCVVREIRTEQARCLAELDAAQTVAEVDAVLARCHARLQEIDR